MYIPVLNTLPRMSLSIMTFLPGIYLLLHDSLQTFMNTQMKLLGAALNSRNLGTHLYYRISCSTIIVCFDVISALSCEDLKSTAGMFYYGFIMVNFQWLEYYRPLMNANGI